jgi:hypothetical protein
MGYKGESDWPTPWAITCEGNELGAKPCNEGNLIFLTAGEYYEQLHDPLRRGWECPRCAQPATFSQENCDKFMGELMDQLERIKPEVEKGVME